MLLALVRRLPHYMNVLDLPKGVMPPRDKGASHSSVAIMGAICFMYLESSMEIGVKNAYWNDGQSAHQSYGQRHSIPFGD